MIKKIPRILILILVLALAGGIASAETEKDGYHFDDKGFLTGEDNTSEEYILEDEETGVWQYASENLAITVTRTREKVKKGSKKIREYCVAEIWCSPESPLGAIQSNPNNNLKFKGEALPGIEQRYVEELIEKHPSVLAVSDDMYGLRITPVGKGKTKYDYHGVVIRNGEVLATKTRKSPEEGKKDKRPWPNMDTLAVNRDGSMNSGGEINPALQNEKYYPAKEPRIAIGMIEPYHYIIVAHAGRPKESYEGAKLLWMAEKMKELGCTEALNLDGGDTVALAFNNKVIIHGNMKAKKLRNLGSLIAFGLKDTE